MQVESTEWHAELTIFWRQEVNRREEALRVASEELEAARRAVSQHEFAAIGDNASWLAR